MRCTSINRRKFPYENYFDADTSAKLATILSAENHVLGLPSGKKRYIEAVTVVASNESDKQLLAHDKLRELAVVLTQKVRENASIDLRLFGG